MKIKHLLLLVAILLLGSVLRLHHLGDNPRILNRDEAALAYNAQLLQKSGLDEWGQSWPLAFKSFGDYKLPGYIYTLLTLFSFLPNNDFVVRLPAALAGIAILYIVYLISLKCFSKKQESLMLILVLAVLPSMIFYSRMAWEANLGLMWSLLSILLLFFSHTTNRRQQDIYSAIGVLAILLSVVTYNTPLLYLPFIILAYLIFHTSKPKKIWVPTLIAMLAIFLLGLYLLSGLTEQKSSITLFSNPTVWHNYTLYRQDLSGLSLKFFGSRYYYWLKLMFANFINSFSSSFLVTQGGSHPWHSTTGYAHLYWSVYLSALVGIVLATIRGIKQLIQGSLSPKMKNILLLLGLLLASLAPAVVTVDAPHATRSLLFFVLLIFFAIYGVTSVSKLTKVPQLILLVFIAALSFEASIYFNDYFIDYPTQQSALKPGFDIAVMEIDKKLEDTQVAVIADGYQYISAAWYLKMSPDLFFETIAREGPDTVGLYSGTKVGQFKFIKDESELQADEELVIYWDSRDNNWRFLDINDETI